MTDKWIPVNERLPEEGQNVLCTVRELCDYPDCDEYGVPETFMCEGSYHHSQDITQGWYIYRHPGSGAGGADVIAWMPLPEPYKTGKGAKE